MRATVLAAILVVVGGPLVTAGCGDGSTNPPPMGSVSVVVIDIGTDSPVADVEVRIAGTDQVAKTDENGMVTFELATGSYFVDAQVCCLGAGWIEHHVEVEVERGKTTRVELSACLACV